jgi:hypothetical protein
MHVNEVRPRKDRRGVDLLSDALPFGGLWYAGPNAAANAIDYAKFFSRSHDAVISGLDERIYSSVSSSACGRTSSESLSPRRHSGRANGSPQ